MQVSIGSIYAVCLPPRHALHKYIQKVHLYSTKPCEDVCRFGKLSFYPTKTSRNLRKHLSRIYFFKELRCMQNPQVLLQKASVTGNLEIQLKHSYFRKNVIAEVTFFQKMFPPGNSIADGKPVLLVQPPSKCFCTFQYVHCPTFAISPQDYTRNNLRRLEIQNLLCVGHAPRPLLAATLCTL